MYALRERRVHVTQEDFELAVAKARLDISLCVWMHIDTQFTWAHLHRLYSTMRCLTKCKHALFIGHAEGRGKEHVH